MDERITILCVDDEKSILTAIKRSFLEDDFEILNAASGPEGLEILRKVAPIQVVISDFRMPGMNGVDFLREVCKYWPETVRILSSGFADLGAIISAINEGQISKFIPKPWKDEDMKVAIHGAIKQYYYRQENMQLAQELRRKDIDLQQLNNKLGHLQNIFFGFPMATILVDLNGVTLYCNKKGAELFGKDGQGIIGTNRSNSLPDEINNFIKSLIQKGGSL